MPELDAMNPSMGPQDNQVLGAQPGETDQEGAMAKADLYKLANYSFKLFKKMDDNDQLEAWVQAKITKAADYIASVYHYLEYEMEFSEYGAKLENSDVYSEGQKIALKNKLMEAKDKIKALKVKQAEKIKEGSIFGGHEQACGECGGSGMVQMPERSVPEEIKAKVEKYNRKAKAMHAASKRIDKNKNGIPDDEELGEEQSSTGGEITRGKGFTRHSHNPNRFTDEPHTEPKSQAKSKSAADKSGEKAADKQTEKDSKDWSKRFGKGSVTKVEQGKKVDPDAPKPKKEKEVDETYGQGVYEGKKKKEKAVTEEPNEGNEFSGELVKAKASGAKEFKVGGKTFPVKEALKGKQKKLDVDQDGDIEADDLADLRAGKKEKKVDEGSTGDYSAKKAAAGKDIGKPGKNFAKIAKKSGGGEKGEKIAGAVLKNLRAKNESYVKQAVAEAKKKSNSKPDFLDMDKDGDKSEPMKKAVADKKEVVKESAELDRMKQFLTRLNG